MNWRVEVTAIYERIRGTGMTLSPVGLVLRINMDGEIPEMSAVDGDVVLGVRQSG